MRIAGTLLGLLVLVSCDTPPAASMTELWWDPPIDRPIDQLRQDLEKQRTDYTISNLAVAYDAKLYILFHKFISSLPESERAKEIEVQRQWMKKRGEQVDAAGDRAYALFEGHIYSLRTGEQFLRATQERIREIEVRMKKTVIPPLPSVKFLPDP